MEIPTREQYENRISQLENAINEAIKARDARQRHLDRSKSTCPGIRGWRVPGRLTECDAWKQDGAKLWAQEYPGYDKKISNAKQALWDYQKDVAKAEQDAQVEAVRQAIADQVRLEQERIQQSQQNQIIMQEAPPAEPEPSAMSEKITPMSEKITPFELPFHHNYLIPIIAIGGYLVLRN